jgi:anti-sigma-K factor RskA
MLLQKMKSVENPQAFAVTLEPKGGSAVPTLNQMFVMGKNG